MTRYATDSREFAPGMRGMPHEARKLFVEAANVAAAGGGEFNDHNRAGWAAVRKVWEQLPNKTWRKIRTRKGNPTAGDVHIPTAMGGRAGPKPKRPKTPGDDEVEELDVSGVFTRKYDPNQPRADDGKWTDGGGGGAHPGEGYSSDAVLRDGKIHTSNVYDAVRALHENRPVELDQPRQVSVLLDKLGEISKDMIARGEDAPNFNLCNVTIRGTNLFCADAHGIPRIQMPQIGKRTGEFLQHLKDKGYSVTEGTERTDLLRATQSELNGANVAALAAKMRSGNFRPGDSHVISRDNYILDGHHRWAAQIGIDAAANKFGGSRMNVQRVDIGIVDLLHEARQFTGGAGARAAFGAAALTEITSYKAAAGTLYVSRPLLNGEQVRAWAAEQGFASTLPAGDMHVTIAYSKEPVAWSLFEPRDGHLVVAAPRGDELIAERKVHQFPPRLTENGATVLLFDAPELRDRWQEFKDGGASWDFPEYRPHITITYRATPEQASAAQPYPGDLVFGPEVFEEIREDLAAAGKGGDKVEFPEEPLAKGDFEGHPFRGNQYRDFGTASWEGKTPQENEQRWAEHLANLETNLQHAERINDTAGIEHTTRAIREHKLRDPKEDAYYSTLKNEDDDMGKTLAFDVEAAERQRLDKGDKDGHPFHGNQWTSGTSTESSHPTMPLPHKAGDGWAVYDFNNDGEADTIKVKREGDGAYYGMADNFDFGRPDPKSMRDYLTKLGAKYAGWEHKKMDDVTASKGDKDGHPFRGNQYTDGGGGDGEGADGFVASGYREDKDGIHTPEGTTLVRPKDPNVWIVRARPGATIRGTNHRHGAYLNLSDNFAQHHIDEGNADLVWKPKTRVAKGDKEGHEFHGNQWTADRVDAAARRAKVAQLKGEQSEYRRRIAGARMQNAPESRITELKDELSRIEALLSVAERDVKKVGARHSRADSEMLQSIHDHAVNLGATCGERMSKAVKKDAVIIKLDDEQRMVWGWANIITKDGEPVLDVQGDVIEPEELEKATTEFMKNVRVHAAMHRYEWTIDGNDDLVSKAVQIGTVVHSLPLTYGLAKLLGLQTDVEGWIVGVHVTDDKEWGLYKDGTYKSFSIGGRSEFHPFDQAALQA